MRIRILLFLILISVADSFCQNQNSIWCFGDSAGIDFSSGAPLTFASGMDGRGSCVSVADSNGNLLFYADTKAGFGHLTCTIYNSAHQIIQNGDSINGEGWYEELISVPSVNNLYYLFSINEVYTGYEGFYYSVIDMNQNGGLGAVIQKNVQLNNFRNADCVSAIKHGNGRDWWVISKFSKATANTHFNRFYLYRVSPAGIDSPLVQNLLVATDCDNQKLIFNSTGDKLMQINVVGLLAEYDFDRCTGIISNQNIIYPELPGGSPSRQFQEGAYSADNKKFYVSSTWNNSLISDTSWVLQYDLTASNIPASSDTLFYIKNPVIGGAIRLAPDNKIYYTCGYNSGIPNGYPYPDSVRNVYNENLGVVNYPDSAGAACDFQPFSFNLGGKRTYWGLPNNPNYSLGPLVGSPCDTLGVGISKAEIKTNAELFVFYHRTWQTAFINAKGLKGENVKVSVYDLLGNVIYTEENKLSSQYFTRDLNMTAFAKGMYIVNLVTEKERLVKKFIKD